MSYYLFTLNIISRKPVTTKAGLKGEIIHNKVGSPLGTFETKTFVYEKNGKSYLVIADYSGVVSAGNTPILDQDFTTLYDHFQVK